MCPSPISAKLRLPCLEVIVGLSGFTGSILYDTPLVLECFTIAWTGI